LRLGITNKSTKNKKNVDVKTVSFLDIQSNMP